jgi:hypothetical protein
MIFTGNGCSTIDSVTKATPTICISSSKHQLYYKIILAVIKNKGWVNVSDSLSDNEVIQMRGYRLSKLETKTILFKADGTLEGGYEFPSSVSSNNTTNGAVPKDEVAVTKKTDGSSSRALPSANVNTDKALPDDLNAPDDTEMAIIITTYNYL